MNELYGKIAEILDGMIPDDWKKIYLYGEVLEDSRMVYFYFKRKSDDEVVYCHDIPTRYNVDKNIYREILRELIICVNQLHDEYKENNDKVWTNLTFTLECDGSFNIKFNYEDNVQSKYTINEKQIIWEYEVIGLEPEDDENKELINNYIKNNRNMKN